jgi:hypothetical protein
MKRVLIDREARFYKANLHTHSTLSDGRLSVEEIKEEYKKRGYSVVAFTDHEHLINNSHLNDDDFLAITSCEVAIKEFKDQSTLKNHQMRVAHLNFYALDPENTLTPCYNSVYDHFVNDLNRGLIRHDGEYDRVYSPDGINDMVRIANEAGFIVSYNHPTWSLENASDYLNYDGFFAVEIYNHGCVSAYGFCDEHVMDDFWRAGKPILCTASDDAHGYKDAAGGDAFGGWVQIAAPALTYKDIMHALQAGDFYASSGPEIKSLTVENDLVKLEFSDCVCANMITSGRRADSSFAESGKTITRAEFPIYEADGYFRVTVTDKNGKKAWSQIYTV